MELKEGYKRSDIGVFPNDWEITSYTTFGQVIDGDRGKNYPSSTDLKSNGYCLFLNAGNVTKEGFKFNNCEFITQVKDKKLNKGKLNFGDCILTTRGTVGNIAFFTSDVPFEHMRINSGMVILRNNSKALLNSYQYYLFKSGIVGAQLNQLSFGSAQPQLTVKGIKTIQLPLPNIPEQKAIDEVLSDTDAYIESLEQLIEKKRMIKQGVMQELLTGKKRLSGFITDWEEKSLADCGIITMGQSPPGNSYNTKNIGLPLLNGAADLKEDGISISQFTSKPTRKCRKNDLLFCIRATIGNLQLADREYCLGRGVAALTIHENIDRKFVAYQIQGLFDYMRQQSQGGVIKGLRKDELSEMKIKVPPTIEEQISISRIFAEIDKNIQLVILKKQKLVTLKQGMMQELLTGKIRLI